MTTIDEYFSQIHQLIQAISDAHPERYEWRLAKTRDLKQGNPRNYAPEG